MLGKMPKICSTKSKMKMVNETEFDEFLSRISKTLYYGDELVEEDHLSYPVIELAAEIYSDLKTGKSIDRLYLNEATEMTQRVRVNPCYLVLALLYIERLKDCNSTYLDNVAPSQLFLISLVLASKFHDDSEYELSLSMFPNFAEWTRSEIFAAELRFLEALGWNAHVTSREFHAKLVQIERLLATRQSVRRQWMTYTEMSVLLDTAWLSAQVTHLLVTVSAVCLTSYTAGVLTLLASSALASQLSTTAALAILSTTAHLLPSATHLCPLTPAQDTRLSADSVEEELDSLLDENRIEDMIRRLNELGALPAYNGCSETFSSGKRGRGNVKRELDRKWNFNSENELEEPTVLDLLLTCSEEINMLRHLNRKWLLLVSKPEISSALYTCSRVLGDRCLSQPANSTFPMTDAASDAFYLGSIMRNLARSTPSTTRDQSHENIPLSDPQSHVIPLITSALTALTQFSLFDYFPNLNNVSLSSYDGINGFNVCFQGYCEPTKTSHENRYFHAIDQNYRLLHEKIDLKF